MKAWILLGALWALCLCATGQAQQPPPPRYVVGVYAPSLVFGGSLEKARFAEQVAAALSQRTGLEFKGEAFARVEDLKSTGVDFAVLGGIYYAASGLGQPLAYGAGQEQMVLAANPASGANLAQLKGKKLILPPPRKLCQAYVSATALGHQAQAERFFQVESTKDMQSALTAVKIGRADVTLTYASYARAQGLRVLHTAGPGPLPVAVQINPKLPADVTQKVRGAFSGLALQAGGGVMQGFGGSGKEARSFGAAARSRLQRPQAIMSEAARVRLGFDATTGGRSAPLAPPQAVDLAPVPPLPVEEPP